jgi:hypothetical protein
MTPKRCDASSALLFADRHGAQDFVLLPEAPGKKSQLQIA